MAERIEPTVPPKIAKQLSSLALTATQAQRAFMEQLAARQREPNGNETSVDELAKLSEDRLQAVAFFKRLEELGCGTFLAGRRGHESRISWGPYGAIAVAKAFLADADEESLDDGDSIARVDGVAEDDARTGMHRHSFLLRPGLSIAVSLPLDVTKEEANRLADFIRAIPF